MDKMDHERASTPSLPSVTDQGDSPSLCTPRYVGNRREFCGPTAIAAVTGADLDDIRDAIRQASGKIETVDGRAHPVMGIKNEHMVEAMRLLGFRVVDEWAAHKRNNNVPGYKSSQLGSFLDEHGNDGPFIVNVTGHYHAVSHGEICDTYTKLPTDIARFRRRGQWVQHWWKFEKDCSVTEQAQDTNANPS